MRVRATYRLVGALVATMMAALLASCATSTAPNETGSPTAAPAEAEQEDPRAALVERRCSMCHATDRVYSKDYDAKQWDETIERMKRNGLVISDEEKQQVIEYLVSRSKQ